MIYHHTYFTRYQRQRKYIFRGVAMLFTFYTKMSLTKDICFSNIYHHTQFKDPVLNDASRHIGIVDR